MASAPNSGALITLPVSAATRGEIARDEHSAAAPQPATRAASSMRPSRQVRLLDHGVDAVRRGDQRRAVGRHEPALDRSAGLHQLGGDHDVHFARHRHQREDRILPRRRRRGLREQLHIVDRGTRALRDTRHGRRLREVAACSARSTIQSASTPPPSPPMARMAMVIARGGRVIAPFAAVARRPVSAGSSATSARMAASRRSIRRCRKPITARWNRAIQRSQRRIRRRCRLR